MKKLSWAIIGLLIVILSLCSKSTTSDEKVAEDYTKSLGYKITAQRGEVKKYTLSKSLLSGYTLETMPYQQMWAVQTVEPDKYFGKGITIYGFTVKNHPLQRIYEQSKGTGVFIMLSEGKIVGGYSFPNPTVDGFYYNGSLYSLDGKTLEELTGLSYHQWSENWKKKYHTSN